MPVDIRSTVVVFDLDDTLYPERLYLRSGIRHVCDRLEKLTGISHHAAVEAAVAAGERDWISLVCTWAGMPEEAKEALLWMYRLHEPDIWLEPEVLGTVEYFREHASAVLILTDGRSVTQRIKLSALGVGDIPAYISQDYGGDKPDLRRFCLIEEMYPADAYVYVADNPAKDFQACHALGWMSIGLAGSAENIHPQTEVDGCHAAPLVWARHFDELKKILLELLDRAAPKSRI